MKKATAPLLFLILGALGGCIPDPLAVVNIPALPTKLVISSQVVPGQGLTVMVTKSIGALDAGWGSAVAPLLQEIVVEDAFVTLEYGGTIDTLTHEAFGIYHGAQDAIESGKVYNLYVRSPTLGVVTASAVAPRQVPFQHASAALYLTGYDSLASITYGIIDPPELNWYMINVQKYSATDELDRYLNPRVFTRLVSDNEFNGEEFEENFNVIFQNYSLGDTVAVTMSSISEEYHHYLSLRNDSRYSLAGFATEPLNFPSNVKGGYGYFNLHVPDIRIFVLE